MARKTLARRMEMRINRSTWAVFTPADFLAMADRSQVYRALRDLRSEGVLIKFGQGLYAQAKRSALTGRIIPVKPLPELAIEALTRKLKVTVVTVADHQRYNAGRSTQVPTGRVIAVRKRVARKMAYNGQSIKFEYVP